VKGDLFVVRTPNATVGGGEIVDPHPRRHRRFQEATVQSLTAMQQGSPEELVLQALDGGQPLELDALSRQAGLTHEAARKATDRLIADGQVRALGPFFASEGGWERLASQVGAIVDSYHAQNPLRRGMPKEELKSRLGFSTRLFSVAVERLASERVLADDGMTVRLPQHDITFSPAQAARVERLLTLMKANRFSPPSPAEAEQQVGVEPDVMAALVEQGRLRRLNDGVVFPSDVYDEMVTKIKDRLREQGKITVAEVRDLFGTSRKYALAILEHLDEEKVTRRVGDERVLR
jgi:selenocysteine-specific elongation factor